MRMVDLKTKIWPGDVAQWLSVCLACTRPCVQSPIPKKKKKKKEIKDHSGCCEQKTLEGTGGVA
jgi:hypothetical protein